jgi:hypothetical protein
MNDPHNHERVSSNPKINRIILEQVSTQPWSDPVSRHTRTAGSRYFVEIGVEAGDEPRGIGGAVGGNVVVDAVKIGFGRLGQREKAAGNVAAPLIYCPLSAKYLPSVRQLSPFGLCCAGFAASDDVGGEIACFSGDGYAASCGIGVAVIDGRAQFPQLQLMFFKQSQSSADNFACVAVFPGLDLGGEELIVLGG